METSQLSESQASLRNLNGQPHMAMADDGLRSRGTNARRLRASGIGQRITTNNRNQRSSAVLVRLRPCVRRPMMTATWHAERTARARQRQRNSGQHFWIGESSGACASGYGLPGWSAREQMWALRGGAQTLCVATTFSGRGPKTKAEDFEFLLT